MIPLNKKKIEDLIKTPREVEDGRYDNLLLDAVKYSDTLTLIQWGAVPTAVILGILGFFGLSYTWAILAVFVYVAIFIAKRFYIDEQNRKLTREAARNLEMSVVSVVQSSDLYAVTVFAKDNRSLQADSDTLLEVAQKLREIGNTTASNNPQVAHIQKRLWDTKDYFSSEELPFEVVGVNNLWWCVQSVSGRMADDFNVQKDTLMGFVVKEGSEVSLALLKEDFYRKYLN